MFWGVLVNLDLTTSLFHQEFFDRKKLSTYILTSSIKRFEIQANLGHSLMALHQIHQAKRHLVD